MKFDELQKILEDNFSTDKLSDIAHELGVTPQVVSNWKSRNQVPYKYVKIVRKKILKLSSDINFPQDKQIQSGLDPNYLESSSIDSFEVILNYFDLVKKGYRIVLLGGLISLFIALVHVNFIKKPNHVARARVLPASSSGGSNLGGIASQFGISVANSNESSLVDPKLYPDIIKSRRLARKLLRTKFQVGQKVRTFPLVKILADDFEDSTITNSEIKSYTNKVIQMISVKLTKSNLLDLEVGTTSQELSKNLMEALISNLELLLISLKIEEISEKKEFIRNRIRIKESELVLAEDELRLFREQNRKINFSPALLLEEERFIRNAEVKKQVFITLKSQLEMTQINENNNKRMIHILDPPEYFGDNSFSTLQIILIFTSLGMILSCALIILIDWLKENKMLSSKQTNI